MSSQRITWHRAFETHTRTRRWPGDELREHFSAAGVDVSKKTIVHCAGGVSCCGAALALDRLGAEYQIYDGPWRPAGERV